ncbi:unnamed protein product, partial [Prorocentrum cordatum]
ECKSWTPTTTLSKHGHIVSDPLAPLETEAARFAGLWQADKEPDAIDKPLEILEPLDILTPDDIRKVSRSYSTSAAFSVDWFHMRHCAGMSDGCLE